MAMMRTGIRPLLLVFFALAGCAPQITIHAPKLTVRHVGADVWGRGIWRVSLSEPEIVSAPTGSPLLVGAVVAMSDSATRPPSGQVRVVTAFVRGTAPARDSTLLHLTGPDGPLLTAARTSWTTEPSGAGLLHVLRVQVPLEVLVRIATSDSVMGHVGDADNPTFRFRLTPAQQSALRELVAESGAAAWLEEHGARVRRAERVHLTVADSVHDSWNDIASWHVRTPRMPLPEPGRSIIASVHVRVRGASLPGDCSLTLALGKNGDWTRTDFEGPSSSPHQTLEFQLDGERAPGLDQTLRPRSGLNSAGPTLPAPLAVAETQDVALVLAEIQAASAVRMRVGRTEPFELGSPAVDALRALLWHVTGGPDGQAADLCWSDS